jgi:hypothetical protein
MDPEQKQPIERFENSAERLHISTVPLLGKWGDGPTDYAT